MRQRPPQLRAGEAPPKTVGGEGPERGGEPQAAARPAQHKRLPRPGTARGSLCPRHCLGQGSRRCSAPGAQHPVLVRPAAVLRHSRATSPIACRPGGEGALQQLRCSDRCVPPTPRRRQGQGVPGRKTGGWPTFCCRWVCLSVRFKVQDNYKSQRKPAFLLTNHKRAKTRVLKIQGLSPDARRGPYISTVRPVTLLIPVLELLRLNTPNNLVCYKTEFTDFVEERRSCPVLRCGRSIRGRAAPPRQPRAACSRRAAHWCRWALSSGRLM